MEKKIIVVVGGNGYLGKSFVSTLKNQGMTIIVLDISDLENSSKVKSQYDVFINTNLTEIIFAYAFIFNTLNELLDTSSMELLKSEFKKIYNYFDIDN